MCEFLLSHSVLLCWFQRPNYVELSARLFAVCE